MPKVVAQGIDRGLPHIGVALEVEGGVEQVRTSDAQGGEGKALKKGLSPTAPGTGLRQQRLATPHFCSGAAN